MRQLGVSVNDHDPGSALRAVASGVFDAIQVIYAVSTVIPGMRREALKAHGWPRNFYQE